MSATFELDGLSSEAWRRLANGRWSLCLGAGVNGRLMPDWQELTRRIVNHANGTALDEAEFCELLQASRWNLDAWIQQALNRSLADGGSPQKFSEHLRGILYEDVLALAEQDGIRTEVSVALNNPQRVTKNKFDKVVRFFKDRFSDTTVYKLASILTESDLNSLPIAVLNFNADTFFETISVILRKWRHISSTHRWEDPPQIFSRIVRSSEGVSTRVPIYHLHGCVLPQSLARNDWSETLDAMVFPENSYTNIAGRVFTWAQSIFLYHAQADSLCFVGLSMADANIRRWLSWTFEGYQADLRPRVQPKKLSGRHLWLTTKPKRRAKDPRTELYPHAMRHLGVQVCWISSWSQFDAIFRRLLGSS